MVLQAFLDDSYTPDGVFVLAGHISSSEVWESFSRDWEAMLRMGTLAPDGSYHFKMAEMAQTAERMERVEWFYRIIEAHDLIHLTATVDMPTLRRPVDRIWSLDSIFTDRNQAKNPFRLCFRAIMDMFHANRESLYSLIPATDPVDFIFDEQTEKRLILSEWDDYIRKRDPEIRKLYGSTPRFENDRRFLPLQAADFHAWWMRKYFEDGQPAPIEGMIYRRWKKSSHGKMEFSLLWTKKILLKVILISSNLNFPARQFTIWVLRGHGPNLSRLIPLLFLPQLILRTISRKWSN